jgi:hypothetical protein
MNFISQIYSDPSLNGHCLTQIPEKINDTKHLLVTHGEKPSSYGKCKCLVIREYTIETKYPNGNIKKITSASYLIPARSLEILIRKILALSAFLTIGFLGFTIKTLDLINKKVRLYHISNVIKLILDIKRYFFV